MLRTVLPQVPPRLLAPAEGLVVLTVGHLTLLYGAEMIKGTISATHAVSTPFYPIRLSARSSAKSRASISLSDKNFHSGPFLHSLGPHSRPPFSPGLYYKLHGTHRPEAMKKTVIKRRRRVPAATNATTTPTPQGQNHHQASSSGAVLRSRSPVSAIPHRLNLEQQAAEALVAVGRSSPALPHPYSQQATHYQSPSHAPNTSSSYPMKGRDSPSQQRMDESSDYPSPHRLIEVEHETMHSTPSADEPRSKRPRRSAIKKDTSQEEATSYGSGASSTTYSSSHHSQQFQQPNYPQSQQQHTSQGERGYGVERETEVDELSGEEGSGSLRSTSSHSHRSFSGPGTGIGVSSASGGPGAGANAGGRGGTPLRRLPELNMPFPDRPKSAASNASFAGGRASSRGSTAGPSASGASGGDLPSIDSYMRATHSGTPTPRLPPGVSSSSPPSAPQLDKIPTRAEMERHYALMRHERQRLVEMLGTTDRMLASMRRVLDAVAPEETASGGASTSVPLRLSGGGAARGSGSVWALNTPGGESLS